MSDFISDSSGTVLYSNVGGGAIFEIQGAARNAGRTTRPTINKAVDKDPGNRDVLPWGVNNDHPAKVVKDTDTSTVIPSTLRKQINFLVSGGVVFGKITGYSGTGENFEIQPPASIPKVTDWAEVVNMDSFCERVATDLVWFYNAFVVLVLSRDRKQIVNIDVLPASHCRMSPQEDKLGGRSRGVYVNANWDHGNVVNRDETLWYPLLNPEHDVVGQIKRGKYLKYVLPLQVYRPGYNHYPKPEWDSARTGGWLDVGNAVPKFKTYLMKNQMSIKWHIQVPSTYWESQFKNWAELSQKEQLEKKQDTLRTFVEMMKGVESAGNALLSEFFVDPDNYKEFGGWKVTALEHNIADGAYNEDSQESANHQLYATGMDGALVGNGPGKNMGGGSGSEKRVAFNVASILGQPMQRKILFPIRVALKYNQFEAYLEPRFLNNLIARLDSGSETTSNA